MAYNPTTNTTDQTASGSLGVLNATVPLVTNGAGTAIFEITGTWVGTITFEGSNNNFTTSQAVDTTFLGGIQTSGATTTTNGFFSVLSGGFAKIQARMSSYTSGTATILANGSQADRIIVARQGNPNNLQTLATLNTGSATIGSVGVNANTSATALYTRETGAAATTGQISVGTSATVILAANTNRKRLLIIQHGTTDVFVGGTGVTTTTGLLLKGVAGNQLLIKHAGAVSAIVGAGTQTVSYIEETV